MYAEKGEGGRSRCGFCRKVEVYPVLANFPPNNMLKKGGEDCHKKGDVRLVGIHSAVWSMRVWHNLHEFFTHDRIEIGFEVVAVILY